MFIKEFEKTASVGKRLLKAHDKLPNARVLGALLGINVGAGAMAFKASRKNKDK